MVLFFISWKEYKPQLECIMPLLQALTALVEHREDRQKRRKRASRAINKMKNMREGKAFSAWVDWKEVRALPFLVPMGKRFINLFDQIQYWWLQDKQEKKRKANGAIKRMQLSNVAKALSTWSANVIAEKAERGKMNKALNFVRPAYFCCGFGMEVMRGEAYAQKNSLTSFRHGCNADD